MIILDSSIPIDIADVNPGESIPIKFIKPGSPCICSSEIWKSENSDFLDLILGLIPE